MVEEINLEKVMFKAVDNKVLKIFGHFVIEIRKLQTWDLMKENVDINFALQFSVAKVEYKLLV